MKCDKELFPAFEGHQEAQEWREETTFCQDFLIAERFGIAAVKDTFNRAFKSWGKSAKYMCELAVVTNQLCWRAAGMGMEELGKVYNDAYYKCYNHIFKADDEGNNASPFTDEEVTMIYKVLD